MKFFLANPKGLRISDCGLGNADCGLDQCVVEDVGLFNPQSEIRNPARMQFSIPDFGLNRYAVAEHSAFQSAIRNPQSAIRNPVSGGLPPARRGARSEDAGRLGS